MVFRTTNPALYNEVDGIVISEVAPPPQVQGVPTNVAILLGQFQRGPTDVLQPSGSVAFLETYGRSSASGNLALVNKRFGVLKIKRVVAAAAAAAELDILGTDSGAGAVITFTAKSKGSYGDLITVKTEEGDTGGTTYIISDTNPNKILPDETYRDIAIGDITSETFRLSKLVNVDVLDTESGEPALISATPLAGGDDGTVADTDYEAALAEIEEAEIANVVFLDAYTANRRQYLKQHVADTADRMVILANEAVYADADAAAAALVADVASYRDNDGRIIYVVNDPSTLIDGNTEFTSPAAWMASLISQLPAWVDPAAARSTQLLAGITGLRYQFKRSHYVQFMQAGICAFESKRGQFKFKSGIVTQIANSSKLTILRRRMADFLTTSAARFLENWQNEPNRQEDRNDQAAGILAFVEGLEEDRILPRDSEVQGGNAKIVDAQILNTDSSVAAGFNRLLWKQRIFSSQRFIVLQAEIGESVVVTEA